MSDFWLAFILTLVAAYDVFLCYVFALWAHEYLWERYSRPRLFIMCFFMTHPVFYFWQFKARRRIIQEHKYNINRIHGD